MLVSLSVQNYALIKRLQIDFTQGYSVITGETGAGKSILLGALGLVLGNRADLTNLKDKDKKCVIEAEFQIDSYKIEQIFEELELDYEPLTIIRRELLPNGKSRAFVNDTPVNLKALQELKEYLLDIHSQHNTRSLSDKNYQFYVVDALAGNLELLKTYQAELKKYKKAVKELAVLKDNQQEAQQQYEYNLHLYKELQNAKLKEVDEIETLEAEIEKLSHAEDIKTYLYESLQVSTEEQIGVQTLLNQLQVALSKIAPFDADYSSMHERAKSLKIELDDLVFELEKHADRVEANPEELETLNDRLSLLFDLQKKHFVTSLAELIKVSENLERKVGEVEDAADLLASAEKNVNTQKAVTLKIAQEISDKRKKVVDDFKLELEIVLSKLSMENAQFVVDIQPVKEFTEFGIDDVSFLLSSNKGSDFGLLKKVASGGELSRIMLGIKMILSKFVSLPTILFDEIDTGVSGDVATKIADVMNAMGQNMQVITITHLPQVASKAQTHYKVFKKVEGEETVSYLTQLAKNERIEEIAEMLGGKDKTQSAIEHATQLLSI
ncbi:DNA repair protein RecN [Wenyingzhuangia marina]|uniref:DNA repair protein RecN n=1 Tax=Wenyingzhuangia marina TaxID=1195760 RepID=A0A1M5VA26_9FLAO|nr:DNA repair protein RecN [Wenyingzhuangia marina]GGF73401.1 DNA repair protein RecN [Wenyingzhuangia marina]SHH72099.1 DNA replication and repair protein RecN [Wenyingzhuangia marina]